MAFKYDPIRQVIYMPIDRNNVFDYVAGSGFLFTDDVLTRYFLSLQTKPFVILTGISGTGKTKIAQLLADYCTQGLDEAEKRKRIAFVPVRPDWTDNRGLLGYFNPLDKEYHSTDALNLLLHANAHPGDAHFLILDEMNLARVEHYFSDVLSIMESRASNDDAGEFLPLHEVRDAKTPNGEAIPGTIPFPPNVYVTGTVNVDETTYMFSPKVLDRANVIEFNDVNISRKTPPPGHLFRLKEPDVRGKLKGAVELPSMGHYRELQEKHTSAAAVVEELHDKLKAHHLHFGYRVTAELARFILLAAESVKGDSVTHALDVQVLQKILPKFHGTQERLGTPLADALKILQHNGLTQSATKVERMMDRLKEGYVSFFE